MCAAASPIACRVHSYAPFEPLALPHIASLGLRHVEIPVPTEARLAAVSAELKRFGLSVTSLQGRLDLSRDDPAAQIDAQAPAFAALGAKIFFTSAKRGDLPLERAVGRLRAAGDAAARNGLTLALETHPDLVTNGDVAVETMRVVKHPHVRLNFDPANLHFYNTGVDECEELRKMLPYVAAAHLKDTPGGLGRWAFPALGRGMIDFRRMFAILDEAGFRGPAALEIEGIEGEQRDERLTLDRIAESVGFLRGLGRL